MATKRAARKTPAKKTNTRSNGADNSQWAGVELPAGYTAIVSGEFGQRWNHEENPLLEGVSDGTRDVETGTGKNKRTSRVMTIVNEDGRFDVWESAALAKFFDEVSEGDKVAIAFQGYRDTGKGAPMKVLVGAIAAGKTASRAKRR